MANTLIKWPGGKAREIQYIEKLIPEFERYVEPFFGGGAMYFYLKPQKALINDISKDLIDFYILVKEQNKEFHDYLISYDDILKSLIDACNSEYNELYAVYKNYKDSGLTTSQLKQEMATLVKRTIHSMDEKAINNLVLDYSKFESELQKMTVDKIMRTVKIEEKAPFSEEDLKENLITGFVSGLYMYFRSVFNDILLKRIATSGRAYDISNYYFIREYCYGSMFRYNSKGEFNIPYGGMSYNKKNFRAKIDGIFNSEVKDLFSNTKISCLDFEDFIEKETLVESDFMFLDPPYDTDFSDYEGKDFTQNDQKRLADVLRNTKAKFILIIKNTEFIYTLYDSPEFNILSFDKTYTYNVRSRNDRNVEHLIITNIKNS